MFKKYIHSAVIGLSCSTLLHAYDKDLETLYPESTMLYGRVDSIERLAKLDPEHPIAKLFEHKAFQKYLMDSENDEEEMDELNEATEAFLMKHCTNRASFGILDIGIGRPNAETTNSEDSQAIGLSLDPKFFGMAMTIDCTATEEELDELLKLAKKSSLGMGEIVVEEFEGVNYYVIEQKEEAEEAEEGEEAEEIHNVYMALVDELLIVTVQEEDIKDYIGKVKAPSKEKTLAGSAKYLDVADKLKKYDISMYVRFDQMFNHLIANKETSLLNFLDEQPQLKLFINRKAIEEDLHLDAFDNGFWGAKVTEEGGDMKFGFAVKSQEGVAGLFQHDKFIPEIPKFAFESFKSMSVSSYDFKANFLQLETLFKKVSPLGLMTVKGQAPEMYKMMKTNIFENLEPYYVTLTGHIDPALSEKRAASQIYVGKVKNADLVYQMMAKGKEMSPGVKTHEFMGEKVYQMSGDDGVSYYGAVVNNYLVVTITAEDEMWRHVISQIKNPGKDIASHKTLADMWDSMPNEEVSMSYQDLGQMILDSHFAEAAVQRQLGDGEAAEEAPDVSDLNYSLISKFYQEDNFWFSHIKLKDYSPQKK